MNEYDLFRGMSELDEDLIMKPRKLVSGRMNLLFCLLAANVSHFIPHSRPITGILMYFLSFALMYGFWSWQINRKKNRKLLIEDEPGDKAR